MPRVSAGHQKRQRERIVVAAETCFAENGFHATSMDDVVNAAGMSTSTVYNYFPGGKNELIVTVCKERTDAVFARIAILAKRENPPSLREVYAEVALAFWRHMDKVDRERLRSDEEDPPDEEDAPGEGEEASEEGWQAPDEGGRASGSEEVADGVDTDEALQMFEALGRADGAEPPEWMLRSVRLAVNAWAETIRNPGLNRDMRRRHSEFRKALIVLVDRWKACGVVDPALPTADVVRLLMDTYFGAIVDFVITGESRYERSTAALERVLSPRGG